MRLAAAAVTMGTALVLSVTAAAAQEKPDFSGEWTLDSDKTSAANPDMPAGGRGGRGGRGMMMGGGTGPLTLTLDETTFTREAEGPQGPVTFVYTLDGSPQDIAMGPMQGTAKAAWDGNTIAVETTMQGQMGSFTSKTVYAFEDEWLVVSTTAETPNGEINRKQYYKKSS